MKIGFDFRMGGSINSGIGRYSFELLKHLLINNQKLNSPDEYFVFFHPENCAEDDLAEITKLGGKLIPAPFRHYGLVGEQIKYPRLLTSYNLDLMHFPNFNVPVRYRGKYVVTIHDMVHHKISGHKKSTYHKFLLYKYVIGHAAKFAQKVITVSEAAKKEIVEFLGVDPQKIEVIYEATDLDTTPANFEEIKELLLLTRPYLLFVGTLERKKNIITLCRGFDVLLQKYKYDIDLVIAGKPDPHYPEIRTQAMQIKHPEHLVFTGFVPTHTQTALYQNAYAFVTASLHEGFGLPGLEAMQYGVPVVAANTEVLNEVYDNGAIFFDPLDPEDIAEKLNLLLRDTEFYKQVQARALERAALFSWTKTAEETYQVYQSVINPTFNHTPEYEI
ncbi:MAG: glycosyltransferase family 1 protein [Candidatus Doudnabacteria bacterium]